MQSVKRLSKVVLLALTISFLGPPANAEPSNFILTANNGSSAEPGSTITASIRLDFISNTLGDAVNIEAISKSLPAGATAPIVSIGGIPNLGGNPYKFKNDTTGSVGVKLPVTISPTIVGTYVYTMVASITGYPALTRTTDLTFVLNPAPTPILLPDSQKPTVDWQTSGISKTQITLNEEVSAWARITDNVGVTSVTAYLYANNPMSGQIGAGISENNCKLTKGDSKDGIWTCFGLKVIEKLSKDDKYSIAFDPKDAAGNSNRGQAIGSVTIIQPAPTPSTLIPTKVSIDKIGVTSSTSEVALDANGLAKVTIYAYVQPVDLAKLPPGRSSLDIDLVFKGSGGPGCSQQPKQSIGTYKEGYKFFILEYTLSSVGSCEGTFQFYGDKNYEKTDYPTFKFTVLPFLRGDISLGEVSLANQNVNPGDLATVYYRVTFGPAWQPTTGLGAGIGEFGEDPGPFGEENSSIGWTLGLAKIGDNPFNGLYKSEIRIPLTAKPGTYKTWVFWKGILGPVFGPNINILGSEYCQNTLLLVQGEIEESVTNYQYWQLLWSDPKSIQIEMKKKGIQINKVEGIYLQYINSEAQRLNSIFKKYDYDGKLKNECGSSKLTPYSEWVRARAQILRLQNDFLEILRPFVVSRNSEYFGKAISEIEAENQSWDDPAKFQEQVDHFYMKYVISSADQAKLKGMVFNFSSKPPLKPIWTSSRDGSNAKKIETYLNEIGYWWSLEGKRFADAMEQHDLLNILNWVQELQKGWVDYINREVNTKFGLGGKYKYIRSIPTAPYNLLNNPNSDDKLKFEDLISDWAQFEIRNLSSENFTKNLQSSDSKLCVDNLNKTSSLIGRYDSQIVFLLNIWSSFEKVSTVIKSKKITLVQYRILVDQEVQNPYLSELYDLAPILLSSIKANCAKSTDTAIRWQEVDNNVKNEITKLQNFLATISSYFDGYRNAFSEIKPTPMPTSNQGSTTTSIKPGVKCIKLNSTAIVIDVKYTCIKLNNAFVWNKGVKVTPTPTPTPIEDNGIEEDPAATLDVSIRPDGKYSLNIVSNISSDNVVITATKKGSKTITYKVSTNEFGSAIVITSRKLSGFTLTLRFDSKYMDKTKAI